MDGRLLLGSFVLCDDDVDDDDEQALMVGVIGENKDRVWHAEFGKRRPKDATNQRHRCEM